MISLRCTVLRVDRPDETCDVDVEAPSGATASDLVRGLVDLGVLDRPLPLCVDAVAVDDAAVLGRRPLVHGAVLVAGASWRDSGGPGPGPLELHVVSGPDAGHVVALRPGTTSVGRSADASLQIADERLSRQHFALTLDSGGLHVCDLDSTNGTTAAGVVVGPNGQSCPPGTRVVAGGTTFIVRSPSTRPIAWRPTGAGKVAVVRGPRSTSTTPSSRFHREPAPRPAERAALPWVALLAPLALCVALALVMHQATYLLLGLMSPVSLAASHVVERRSRRRRDLREREAWSAADDRTSALVAQAVAADLSHRRQAAPDAAQLLVTARLPGHRLWERGPDASDLLAVCVGSGAQPSSVAVVAQDGETHPTLDDAPVVLDLADVGHLGVSGDVTRVGGALRLLVVRLAVQCSPRAVQIALLGPSWSWARWLPHQVFTSPSALAQEVRQRRERAEAHGEQPVSPRVVVVVDDVERWASDASFATLLDDGPAAGVHVVSGARRPQDLPSTCGAVLTVDDREPSVLTSTDGRRVELVVDGVGEPWADDVARALAPLEDATPQPGSLPTTVRLADVCGIDPTSAHAVAAAWSRTPRSTTVALGEGVDGTVAIDLVRDGPHALVAGTTGAGKSELLQTLACSLALGNRPDELALVLVDYKGGAAFRELADLPHVVGLVTDLDPHLAERALASLQAELTRRERLLADAGASDFTQYLARREDGAAAEPLARLVLVVDEFRLLADELPTFLDGLVRLASIGRSLGVHLVLATQRPAGVLTADIKANVNLRICLRVRDRSESQDVVDVPDAAFLPLDVPGRALLRTGSDPVVPLQVATVATAATAEQPTTVRVQRATTAPPVGTRSAITASTGPRRLVNAVNQAATACGATTPPSPWLAPLPDVIRPADLDALLGKAADPQVRFGLVDRPDVGGRAPLAWDADSSSHLAISGMARTGRSSACAALVLAAAEHHSPNDLHVHVIEAARYLAPALARLPHLGTAASTEQPRLVATLVRRLAEERPRSRHTLLLVDGWEAVAESLDALDHGRTTDDLLALLRDGERWGLRAVVTGGRGLLGARTSAVLAERLVLRTADPTDLLLAGATRATPLAHQPPGRALHLPSGHEVQLVWPGDEVDLVARVDALRVRWATASSASSESSESSESSAFLESSGPARPLRLQPLPRRAAVRARSPVLTDLTDLTVEVGPAGDDAEPVDLDLARAPVVAVAGPAGSGRSATLASWAEQLHARGIAVLAVADSASPLACGPWAVRDPAALSDSDAPPPAAECLLVDDADRLPDAATRRVAAWTATAQPRPSLVVATTTDALTSSFSGLASAVRRHRTGVLLQPERPLDGDAFGVVAERPDVRTPGRGLLVVRGRATPVQIALPAGHTTRTEQWGTAS